MRNEFDVVEDGGAVVGSGYYEYDDAAAYEFVINEPGCMGCFSYSVFDVVGEFTLNGEFYGISPGTHYLHEGGSGLQKDSVYDSLTTGWYWAGFNYPQQVVVLDGRWTANGGEYQAEGWFVAKAAPVPLPAAAWLFLAGLGLVVRKRR